MLTVNLDKARHDLGTTAAGRTDYRVFTCLAEYMNTEGVSTVSQNLIAEETGFRRRTVSNSVQRLEEKEFLAIERNMTKQGGIASNIYHINRKYLLETQSAADKRDLEQKPECSACVNSCQDVRRLARLGEVLTNVIHDLLAAYEGKNK